MGTSKPRRIKIICATCGSDDVQRDAWAEWDMDKQEWVLGTVFDAGHCEVCGGDTSLAEVDVAQPETAKAPTLISALQQIFELAEQGSAISDLARNALTVAEGV